LSTHVKYAVSVSLLECTHCTVCVYLQPKFSNNWEMVLSFSSPALPSLLVNFSRELMMPPADWIFRYLSLCHASCTLKDC